MLLGKIGGSLEEKQNMFKKKRKMHAVQTPPAWISTGCCFVSLMSHTKYVSCRWCFVSLMSHTIYMWISTGCCFVSLMSHTKYVSCHWCFVSLMSHTKYIHSQHDWRRRLCSLVATPNTIMETEMSWWVNCRVGQNHIYTVYIRYFWQGNHQLYGHYGLYIRFWPTLVNGATASI